MIAMQRYLYRCLSIPLLLLALATILLTPVSNVTLSSPQKATEASLALVVDASLDGHSESSDSDPATDSPQQFPVPTSEPHKMICCTATSYTTDQPFRFPAVYYTISVPPQNLA